MSSQMTFRLSWNVAGRGEWNDMDNLKSEKEIQFEAFHISFICIRQQIVC